MTTVTVTVTVTGEISDIVLDEMVGFLDKFEKSSPTLHNMAKMQKQL